MQCFDFTYDCILAAENGRLKILGYNSPYTRGQDQQSIEDIEYLAGVFKIPVSEKKQYKIKVRYAENADGSWELIPISYEN